MTGLQLYFVKSSVIRYAGYDPDHEKLYIEFLNDEFFEYSGVPARMFDELFNAPSPDHYFNTNIRPKFVHKRLKFDTIYTPMNLTFLPVSSTWIESAAYSSYSASLYLRIYGRTYVYYNVYYHTYREFMAARSAGQYFHQHIKHLPSVEWFNA